MLKCNMMRPRIKLTASQLVRQIPAIVCEIAEFQMVDALLVCTGVLRDRVARTGLLYAHRHVVLVGTIAAVVDSIAQLVPGDTLMVGALEPSVRITLEVRYAMRQRCYLSTLVTKESEYSAVNSPHMVGLSSELSPQSSVPSQMSFSETQMLLLHWNRDCGQYLPPGYLGGQLISSLMSRQSRAPSQRRYEAMQ